LQRDDESLEELFHRVLNEAEREQRQGSQRNGEATNGRSL
jgi:hypothetical protein